jgi:hypothetical protein
MKKIQTPMNRNIGDHISNVVRNDVFRGGSAVTLMPWACREASRSLSWTM